MINLGFHVDQWGKGWEIQALWMLNKTYARKSVHNLAGGTSQETLVMSLSWRCHSNSAVGTAFYPIADQYGTRGAVTLSIHRMFVWHHKSWHDSEALGLLQIYKLMNHDCKCYMEEYMAMLSQEIGKPIPILKKGYSRRRSNLYWRMFNCASAIPDVQILILFCQPSNHYRKVSRRAFLA